MQSASHSADWSLGGHLAPRGASGEPRIAALIADPGTWSIADGFRDIVVRKFGVAPEAAADLGALDQAVIDKADACIRGNRQLNWKVVQRGFWVHGVNDLRAYLASASLCSTSRTLREFAKATGDVS